MEKICVAVRVRPRISEDSFNGNFWKVEENRISLHKVHGTPVSAYSYAFGIPSEPFLILTPIHSYHIHICYFSLVFILLPFSFIADHIFDESSRNASVYDLLTKDIIHAAVEGFNGMFCSILECYKLYR